MKNTVTNICGIVVAISGAILSLQPLGIVLPEVVVTGAVICGAVATGIIGYFTGKPGNAEAK